VQVGLQGHADRYTYLPGIGISVAVVWIVVDFVKGWRYPRPLFAIAAVVIVSALALSARAQTAFWRDSETLWRRTLAVTKDNDLAHINLSEILVRTNRYDEAISHCRDAIRIYSNNPAAYYNLGISLLRTGHLDEAIPNLQRTLELRPDHVNAALTLAWILATCPDSSVRNGPLAVELTEKPLAERGRSNPTLLHTLAAAYAEAGKFNEAMSTALEALELAKAQNNSRLVQELELNLKNYENRLPLRDSGLTNNPQTR